MEVSQHEPGMFSWAELGTPDVEGSRKFYTELLDLAATDIPMSEAMVCVMLDKNGKRACALYQMPPEMVQMTGGHPMWLSYFTVESADDAAARIRELGGTVMQEPFDVRDWGRMAVAQDPTGAVFSVWEPGSHIGAQVFGESGSLAWTELYTTDTDAASKFYQDLFGWSVDARPGVVESTDDYFLFHFDGRPAAGMLKIKEEWGEVPPNWSVYFAVADLDHTIKLATGMGASQVMPPMKVEGVGRFALVKDPQGGYLNFIQLAMPPA